MSLSDCEPILAVLRQIETGVLAVRPTEDPNDVYAGDVAYRVSNGWTIVVFNDCNSFDYIDSVSDEGARKLFEFADDADDEGCLGPISVYSPPAEQERRIWKIPGNCIGESVIAGKQWPEVVG